MQLYFIALIPPDFVCEQVNEIKKYFAQNYQSYQALNSPPHITLRPPFKMFQQKEEELKKSLKIFSTEQSAFTIQLNGFGHFRRDVIFIRPLNNSVIENLYADLQALLFSRHGFSAMPPYPVFHPHITVAFRDLTKAYFEKAWAYFEHKKIETKFVAQRLCLLKHIKQKWEIVEEFPLYE